MLAPTLVLVPGLWHGGWCWARVVRAVGAASASGIAGVAARAVTLTGLGERAHLISPAVDLETHVQDVAAAIECDELEEVVLVGHSYAGVLLGAVAARVRSRVRRLVYLDALVPRGGETALELLPDAVAEALRERAREAGGWRLPPWPGASFGITVAADLDWVDRHLTDHPFLTLTQPVAAPPPEVPADYIACTVRQRDTYVRFAEEARTDPAWGYFELRTGHDAMVTAPEELAQMLADAARRGGGK